LYNDFKNDPLSNGRAELTIASREDLNLANSACSGSIDSKVSSVKTIKGKKEKVIHLFSGPSHDNQIPFEISSSKCNSKGKSLFNGMPNKFDFDWVEYTSIFFDH